MSNEVAGTQLDYALVDVFAERSLEGNMLAIFTDARGLSDEQMQALARETNLSETTFILPRDAETEAREGVRVRIFTTEEEFPFAGHPTLGTAAWLRLNRPELCQAEQVTLALNVGPITVRFRPEQEGPGVFGTMGQNDPVFGQEHDRARVAELLGLPFHALDEQYAPQTVSTGLPFCVVMLRDVAALSALSTSPRAAVEYLATTDAKFFYCLAPAGTGEGFRARMQFYNGEDPATGSAAGCAAAWLVRQGLLASGVPATIAQGLEMRRPSRITVEATREDGGEGARVGKVFVGGRTIPVASGRFLLGEEAVFPQQEVHATAT